MRAGLYRPAHSGQGGIHPVNHQIKSTAVMLNTALIRKTPTAATLENGWFLARLACAKVSAATSAPTRPPKTVTTTKKISHSEALTRLRPRVLYPESTPTGPPPTDAWCHHQQSGANFGECPLHARG
jgi:hypothetical protein